MTTTELINTLRQGLPITRRVSTEIIKKLDRLDWAERSLKAALETYGGDRVQLSRDECGYVCDALEESERLKEAVKWMLECNATKKWLVLDCEVFFGDNVDEIDETRIAARKAVEELL